MPARKLPKPDELSRLYWEENLTPAQIGALFGATANTVIGNMRRHNLPMRSRADAMKLSFQQTERKTRRATVPLRDVLLCRGCGAEWKRSGKVIKERCPYCGKSKDSRVRSDKPDLVKKAERIEKLKAWSKEHRLESGQRSRLLRRRRLCFKISGSNEPRCVRCGCDDMRLLEINHKNGGGNTEMQKGKNSNQFYAAILKGERPVDDLELLCKPCNAIHYLETKYGPLPLHVVWKTDQ